MQQKDVLLAHTGDLAVKAAKSGFAVSKFLTPAEAVSIAAKFSRRRDVTLVLDGGYEGAERVRAVFLNPDRGAYEREELFCALKVDIPPQESLGHRDILGAVMSLGIKRDSIGDIIESPLIFLCLPELSGYIIKNLTKAARTRISLSEIDLCDIPPRTENLTIKTETVSSLRLDSLVSAAFDLPRSKAVTLIEAGLVSLNHEICLKSTKTADEGALLSVRGKGRAKLMEVGCTSKKGRTFVKIGLYEKSPLNER